MQPFPMPSIPSQRFQQNVPGFPSPALQPQQSFTLPQDAYASMYSAAYAPPQQIAPKPLTPGTSIPSEETATNNLTTSKGLSVGLKYGALFSLLAGVPIWGIEKAFKEDNHAVDIIRKMALNERISNPGASKWANRLHKIDKPLPTFLSSIGITGLIGISAGAALGPWMVSRTRKRIIEINQAKAAQQQGTFQPKPLTLTQRLGMADKPVTQPEQDYQTLLQTRLNNEHAFKQGALSVLICKLSPMLLSLPVMLGVVAITKLTNPKMFEQVILPNLKETGRLLIKPVFIIKTAALPLIGGYIAMQTVPWMRRQLGIERDNTATVQPGPTSYSQL